MNFGMEVIRSIIEKEMKKLVWVILTIKFFYLYIRSGTPTRCRGDKYRSSCSGFQEITSEYVIRQYRLFSGEIRSSFGELLPLVLFSNKLCPRWEIQRN